MSKTNQPIPATVSQCGTKAKPVNPFDGNYNTDQHYDFNRDYPERLLTQPMEPGSNIMVDPDTVWQERLKYDFCDEPEDYVWKTIYNQPRVLGLAFDYQQAYQPILTVPKIGLDLEKLGKEVDDMIENSTAADYNKFLDQQNEASTPEIWEAYADGLGLFGRNTEAILKAANGDSKTIHYIPMSERGDVPVREYEKRFLDGKIQGQKETMVLDAGFNNSCEVVVIDKRPIYSTVIGLGEGQKSFDVMTYRLSPQPIADQSVSSETDDKNYLEHFQSIKLRFENGDYDFTDIYLRAFEYSKSQSLQQLVGLIESNISVYEKLQKEFKDSDNNVRIETLFGLLTQIKNLK